MGLKKKILSLSAATALLFSGTAANAETPSEEKINLPNIEKTISPLLHPFKFARNTSQEDQLFLTQLLSEVIKDKQAAHDFSQISALTKQIILKVSHPAPGEAPSFYGAQIMLPRNSNKDYVGIHIIPNTRLNDTVKSFKIALSDMKHVLNQNQINHTQNKEYSWIPQPPIDINRFYEAQKEDARLQNISLLLGQSPGIELKQAHFIYRIRIEKINEQKTLDGKMPIISFRVASKHSPLIERAMTQEDIDKIKKPLIAALRACQEADLLPKNIEEKPFIGTALKFDFLLSRLISKAFNDSLKIQPIFNTVKDINQSKVLSFSPVVVKGDIEVEQPDRLVGFAFKSGTTYFNGNALTGFTITQNNIKRAMSPQEMNFFKEIAQKNMTPEMHLNSTEFWDAFNHASKNISSSNQGLLIASVKSKNQSI